jgi:excinuclease ABC subunit B
MNAFQLTSEFAPAGDQPEAIRQLVEGVNNGRRHQTLLGVTGSGKTFTMANVIQQTGRPALILSHNKTLAAQLYGEFKDFFPQNAVKYFVSYYDYYQPEAYIPQRDIYIEKETSINNDLDRLRLAATSALVSRRDVVIVASVSCIYGLGSPSDYKSMMLPLQKGGLIDREELLHRLVAILYNRRDIDFQRATFRARGDVIECWPAYEEFAYRIEMFGDEVDRLSYINPLTGETIREVNEVDIYPAKHFVTPADRIQASVAGIKTELEMEVEKLKHQGKLLEAQRLSARTKFDVEMLSEVGTCPGVENYSRYLSGRQPGERPFCLLDFFPKDYLLFIDESHVTVPQITAMYAGDRSRKLTLVEHGFRLPSALDNRPLKFEEFEELTPATIYVSATPAEYELEKTGGEVVEQVIRPTGLIDPVVEVHPARGQVAHLLAAIRETVAKGHRVLATALTKRLAEDLAHYFTQQNVKCKWLHSELDAVERVEILNDLREGRFDVVVGINLLREGLDLPEVALVAILDADKEGFLRSGTSLIQTIGRAARNVDSKVILYADTVTPSMKRALDETERRRHKQLAYNAEHGITPKTIKKALQKSIMEEIEAHRTASEAVGESGDEGSTLELISALEIEMFEAAGKHEFERAAKLRDKIAGLKSKASGGGPVDRTFRPQGKSKGKKGNRGSKGPPQKRWRG